MVRQVCSSHGARCTRAELPRESRCNNHHQLICTPQTLLDARMTETPTKIDGSAAGSGRWYQQKRIPPLQVSTRSDKKLWNSYSRLTSQIYPCLFQLIRSYPCIGTMRPRHPRSLTDTGRALGAVNLCGSIRTFISLPQRLLSVTPKATAM